MGVFYLISLLLSNKENIMASKSQLNGKSGWLRKQIQKYRNDKQNKKMMHYNDLWERKLRGLK